MRTSSSELPSRQALLYLADQCVKCGYCLLVCPTYAQTQDEAESPRGRIALIQGWLGGQLVMTPRLAGHLDRCLLCRACESACPSGVAYGDIMKGARAHRFAALPFWQRLWLGLWLDLLANGRWIQAAAHLSRAYTRLMEGLARWHRPAAHRTRRSQMPANIGAISPPSSTAGFSPLHLMRRSGRNLPSAQRCLHLGTLYRLFRPLAQTAHPVAAQSPAHADIDLFIGCTGTSIQGQAFAAALTLCAHLGVQARIPTKSPCCGAIHRHQGLIAAADRALARCTALYADRPLIGVASTCIAELRAAPRLAQAQELCAYLDRLPWPAALELAPLPRRVLVHEPCSHRHLLGGNAAVWRLLARIPDIQLLCLPGETRCCGAAGIYLLQQPAMAQALLAEFIAHIRQLDPAIIVTTNPGCALHLVAGVRESGLEIEVCHPVELIARQLRA
ncbi:(Fe-S)-binding protein [Caldichromatium japonicum]|uniref:(Fe-S)-binding protein n=1 Tax=Caldichromatium japonicum TaxID=2699430 RepID=UPI001FE2B8CF|nr:(Fe-S)-binding protein [Caldichromatium japonicum]